VRKRLTWFGFSGSPARTNARELSVKSDIISYRGLCGSRTSDPCRSSCRRSPSRRR
jgi:hypothetical protein